MIVWRVTDIIDAIAWRVMHDDGRVLLAPTRESADALAATLNRLELLNERLKSALAWIRTDLSYRPPEEVNSAICRRIITRIDGEIGASE